jgi:hypothetical protein
LRPQIVFVLISLLALASVRAEPVSVHFCSLEEARATLTQGTELRYYDRLQLADMRAKTGLALQDLPLKAARAQTINAYRESVQEFTEAERAVLRSAIAALQPILQRKAPLYARTAWSFVKTNDRIEGGLPHTRGDSIVLSASEIAKIAARYAGVSPDKPSDLWDLLVHEQTHVIERRHPELFTPLYAQVFGFRHVTLAPPPEWLRLRRVVNPDAPDVDWAFLVGEGSAQRWILPDVVLSNTEHPRMPADFEIVAHNIAQQARNWTYLDQTMPDHLQPLESVQSYGRAFPEREETFHPAEIAAVMLSEMITGWRMEQPEHPLWPKISDWAQRALR